MLTTAQIEHILAMIPQKTIGLIGDLFLDRYLDIDARLDEPSIETGLTAYQVTRVRSYPGALGTVLNNLVALGVGSIIPITLIGDDGEGYELRQHLNQINSVNLAGAIISADLRTPTYTKPMYGEGTQLHELNRLDIKNRRPTPSPLIAKISDKLHALASECDVIIALDQVSERDCGVVTFQIRDDLSTLARAQPGKLILADSRERIREFLHLTVKPNVNELSRALNIDPNDTLDVRLALAKLAQITQGNIILTRGESPGYVFQHGMDWQKLSELPAFPVQGPIDVCGAGDSCSAGIACAAACGLSLEDATIFGNLVASITVQQLGTTGTASPTQVRTRWQEIQSRRI